MPSTQLTTAYHVALERHKEARRTLVPLLEQMAIETVAAVLPGAARLEAVGEWNEDWIQTLRIDRVLTASGEVRSMRLRVISIERSRTRSTWSTSSTSMC